MSGARPSLGTRDLCQVGTAQPGATGLGSALLQRPGRAENGGALAIGPPSAESPTGWEPTWGDEHCDSPQRPPGMDGVDPARGWGFPQPSHWASSALRGLSSLPRSSSDILDSTTLPPHAARLSTGASKAG